MLVALQIRTNQLSISANLWPLIAYIYQVMIIVTGGFPKKTYFIIIFRSSRTQIFFKTGVVRSFEIVAEKRLCWSLFFFSLRPATLLQTLPKGDFNTGGFSRVKTAKLLRPNGLQLYLNLVPKETSTQVTSGEWKLRNFYEQHFLWNISGGCFCQFDKIAVQWWDFAHLLFFIKNKICGMVSINKICRSGQSMLFTHY